MASHIVGGEFELLHLTGNSYRLNMILYYDLVNANPGAMDNSATVYIYRKRDDTMMGTVFLPLVSNTSVAYTQPACSNASLQTLKLIYSADITLPPDLYNDPQGYYVVWERCCRNYGILNIYSQDPQGATFAGKYAGQTFYLEFPAVVKDGKPFYNSSPRLFPPLSDFAVPNRKYYVDFSGVDDDNDSLVYSLITPLNTTSAEPIPAPSPRPYPDVWWRPGFSIENIVGGHPDLKISLDGFLTATPGSLQGLYVFAVKVDQYRDKVKIGESRRDFQMFVTDVVTGVPPKIVGKKLNDADFTYDGTMAVAFDNTTPDGSRCIQVRVSDDDSNDAEDNYSENIVIKAVPLNFPRKTDISSILPSVTSATLIHGSTKDFTICFPQCPLINGTFQIGIVAYDDACALPLTDTLKIAVTVQPPPNSPPYFTTPTPVSATLNEGDSQTWAFEIRDDDLDSMTASVLTDGFVLADAGMTYTITKNVKGLIQGTLHWDAYCNIYDFTKRTNFQVQILAEDADLCNEKSQVMATYNLKVNLPPVADPLVDTDLTPDAHEHLVTGLVRHIGESLSFNVTGTQALGDFLRLNMLTPGFKPSDYGIQFSSTTGNGQLSSHFQWNLSCNSLNLSKKSMFQFFFVLVDDANKCRVMKSDTVSVQVLIVPTDNTPPLIFFSSQMSESLTSDQMTVEIGKPITITVNGVDPDTDKDNLTLSFIDANGHPEPEGYNFVKTTAQGIVASPFTWNPDCSIFESDTYKNEYVFRFSVKDDHCANSKGDTIELHLTLKDVEGNGTPFLPANVITPNGDNCNDYFAVEGIDDAASNDKTGCGGVANADQMISLPPDNCRGHFQFIRIYNRWGKEVFESTDRKFRWYAQNESIGVYYYLIRFGNADYKGLVSVAN